MFSEEHGIDLHNILFDFQNFNESLNNPVQVKERICDLWLRSKFNSKNLWNKTWPKYANEWNAQDSAKQGFSLPTSPQMTHINIMMRSSDFYVKRIYNKLLEQKEYINTPLAKKKDLISLWQNWEIDEKFLHIW